MPSTSRCTRRRRQQESVSENSRPQGTGSPYVAISPCRDTYRVANRSRRWGDGTGESGLWRRREGRGVRELERERCAPGAACYWSVVTTRVPVAPGHARGFIHTRKAFSRDERVQSIVSGSFGDLGSGIGGDGFEGSA